MGERKGEPTLMISELEVLLKITRWILGIGLLLVGLGSPSGAMCQEGEDSSLSIEIHGMVASTFFLQNNSFGFGNGQSATFVADRTPTSDPWILGGDVRNSRVGVDLKGLPVEGDWTAMAHMEVDFFGGFNGTGPFSDEQPHLRLRSAYVELARTGTSLRLGQAFAPLLGNIPVSLSHLVFPLGYASAGVVGWRYPGIFLSQRLRTSPGLSADLKVAALRGSWTGPGDNLEQESAGESAAFPQLEARLDLKGTNGEAFRWSAYTVAHLDRKDLSGPEPTNRHLDRLSGKALEFGARVETGRVTVQGNTYWGRAIGQQMGQMAQFGDISSHGGWGQVGYHFNGQWSVWVFAGLEDPNDQELLENGGTSRLKNESWAAMTRYAKGPMSVGLECMGATTHWAEPGSAIRQQKGIQLSLSTVYQF